MMENPHKLQRGRLVKSLRAQFLVGFFIMVPIAASILILVWLFNSIDNLIQPLLRLMFSRTIPGVGFAIVIVLIYLLGVVASNVVGRRMLRYGESLLAKVPVFRQLYTSIKEITTSFNTPNQTEFIRVVLVEFPRKGMKAIGFVTNEWHDESGEKLLNVFIPTTPNPTTGFLQIVKEEDVTRTKMSVKDAFKVVISAGKVSPSGNNSSSKQ